MLSFLPTAIMRSSSVGPVETDWLTDRQADRQTMHLCQNWILFWLGTSWSVQQNLPDRNQMQNHIRIHRRRVTRLNWGTLVSRQKRKRIILRPRQIWSIRGAQLSQKMVDYSKNILLSNFISVYLCLEMGFSIWPPNHPEIAYLSLL